MTVHTSPAARAGYVSAIWLGVGLLGLLALAQYAAGYGFVVDLAANVSYMAAFPLGLLGFTSFWLRRIIAGAACLTLAAAATYPLLTTIETPARASGLSEPVTAVLFCNLSGDVAAWQRLRIMIAEEQPDVVALVEASHAIVHQIRSDAVLTNLYPYRITPEPGLQWPQVVLCRHPLELQTWTGGKKRYKNFYSYHRTAKIALPQGAILFSIEHVQSPRTQDSWSSGNAAILMLGDLVNNQIAATRLPFLVAGDFNASPTGFRDSLIRNSTGLKGDPLGPWPVGTWPSSFPRYWRLPLDRIWASEEIVFLNREVLEHVGSDHRPVLVQFRLKEP